MSAFILTDKHFSAIAYAVMPYFAQAFANKLKAINVESVNFCYGKKTRKSKVKLDKTAQDYNPAVICKLINCWDYQSCEDGGWDYQSCEDGAPIDYFMMKAYLYDWVASAKKGRDYDETAGIGYWTI